MGDGRLTGGEPTVDIGEVFTRKVGPSAMKGVGKLFAAVGLMHRPAISARLGEVDEALNLCVT